MNKEYVKIPCEKVSAFGKRLRDNLKNSDREFILKQHISFVKSKNIKLN